MQATIVLSLSVILLTACRGQETKPTEMENKKDIRTNRQWQKTLSPKQYEVLRNKGTELAFTGQYWNSFDKGIYVCAACKNPLFTSDTKFESQCGWPSFDQAIPNSVIYIDDFSFSMHRTEVQCAKCESHLGHVFDDGPTATTGKRFCTNSVSIEFIADEK